jgi:hypothetical protein
VSLGEGMGVGFILGRIWVPLLDLSIVQPEGVEGPEIVLVDQLGEFFRVRTIANPVVRPSRDPLAIVNNH